MNDPIAVWKDSEIIEGHGRLIALNELNEEGYDFKKVPIIRLDNLTDEQRKAYMLVHNKLTMNTDFDFDVLISELDDILDIDMSQYGFSGMNESIDSFFTDDPIEEPKQKDEPLFITKFDVVCKTEREAKILKTFLEKQEIEFRENVGE